MYRRRETRAPKVYEDRVITSEPKNYISSFIRKNGSQLETLKIMSPKGLREKGIQKSSILFPYIFNNCSGLSCLSLSNSNDIFTGSFSTSTFQKSLKELDLSYCNGISFSDVLLYKPENLEILNVSGCKNFSDDFLRSFPNLRRLIMINCHQESVTSDGFELFRSLIFIDIRECPQRSLNEEMVRKLFKNNHGLEHMLVFDEGGVEISITKSLFLKNQENPKEYPFPKKSMDGGWIIQAKSL